MDAVAGLPYSLPPWKLRAPLISHAYAIGTVQGLLSVAIAVPPPISVRIKPRHVTDRLAKEGGSDPPGALKKISTFVYFVLDKQTDVYILVLAG